MIDQRTLEERLDYLREMLDIDESKHVATHRGVPHRQDYLDLHYDRYTHKQTDKEEKRTRAAVLAAAGIASLIGISKQKMLQQFYMAEKYLKLSKTAKTPFERQKALRQFESVIQLIKAGLRQSYTKSYRMGVSSSGVGGQFRTRGFMSPEEARWVESAFKHEMRYLNQLVNDVKAGKSVPTLANRIGLYAKALAAAYNSGQVMATNRDTLIHWRLSQDPEVQHCDDCLYLAGLSPFVRDTLPTVPKAGICRCSSNCRCELEYEVVKQDVASQVRAGNMSKTYVVRKIRDRQRGRYG
jgi:hypothetical protein